MHQIQKTICGLAIFASLLYACGRDTNFVDKEKQPGEDKNQDDLVLNGQQNSGADEDGKQKPKSEDPDIQTIEFTQNPPGKVDILWVIDNSTSMQPLQDSLRNNISAFIEQLTTSQLDFNIAITSTDVCPKSDPTNLAERVCPQENQQGRTNHRGSLIGQAGQKVLKKSDPQLVEKFKKYANLGTGGSSFEHGLTATKLAVQKSLTGQNEDFLRPNAFLSVIVVSDEEDDGVGLSQVNEQGINYWQKNLTRYFFEAAALKTFLDQSVGAAKYSVSSIVGTVNAEGQPCKYNGGKIAEIGGEYLKMSAASGGIKASICTDDWYQSLQKIGEDLASQIVQVQLTMLPEVDSITVTVGGQTSTAWRYVEGNNTIQFNAGAVPKPGAKVKITFLPR